MASVVVDGLVVPIAITDEPALNFCNTRAGWGSPAPKEYLHTYDHLTVWARENDLLPPSLASRVRRAGASDAEAASAVVARAVAFRSALYAVLLGTPTRRDWVAVNVEVGRASAVARLRPGRPAEWSVLEPSTVDTPLHAVAWAAGSLLTSPLMTAVAACPGTGCGWVFADPRGRRRWCSMAWCGNRNKARRHAERFRDADR